MKSLSYLMLGIALILPIALVHRTAQAEVIITGILDGTLLGGDPRAIELYIDGTVNFDDGWIMQRQSGANPFGGSLSAEFSLTGTYSNEFVYVVNSGDIGDFQNVFGVTGDFANIISISTSVNGNGNDAFRLLDPTNTVIDQTGGDEGDDTDIYEDSYLYRISGTGPDGGWNAAHWLAPGNNLLDGFDEAEIAAAVPFGTYVIPAPGALALVLASSLIGLRRRR